MAGAIAAAVTRGDEPAHQVDLAIDDDHPRAADTCPRTIIDEGNAFEFPFDPAESGQGFDRRGHVVRKLDVGWFGPLFRLSEHRVFSYRHGS